VRKHTTFTLELSKHKGRWGYARVVRAIDLSKRGGYAFSGPWIRHYTPTRVRIGAVAVVKEMCEQGSVIYAGRVTPTGLRIETEPFPETHMEQFKCIVASMLGEAKAAGVSDEAPITHLPIAWPRATALALEFVLGEPLPDGWESWSIRKFRWFVKKTTTKPFEKVWASVEHLAHQFDDVSRGVYSPDWDI